MWSVTATTDRLCLGLHYRYFAKPHIKVGLPGPLSLFHLNPDKAKKEQGGKRREKKNRKNRVALGIKSPFQICPIDCFATLQTTLFFRTDFSNTFDTTFSRRLMRENKALY